MEGKRTVISESVGKAMWLQRDGSDAAGVHQVVHQYFDNGVIAENAKLRREKQHLKGSKMPIMDGARFEAWIRPPSAIQWEDFLKLHPEIRTLIDSAIDTERHDGVMKVQLLQPEWVIFG